MLENVVQWKEGCRFNDWRLQIKTLRHVMCDGTGRDGKAPTNPKRQKRKQWILFTFLINWLFIAVNDALASLDCNLEDLPMK